MANRSTGRQNTGKNSSRGSSRGAQGKPPARGGASKNNKNFKGTGRPGAPGRSQKPSVKSGANKSDAKKFKPRKGQAGRIFARERGEYRPDNEYKGPHRPRRPRAEPADRLDVYDRDGVRLQKLMAQAGVASRRVCEMMISEGRVMVDDEVVTELGVRVDPRKAHIQVDGVTIQTDDSKVYYAFNSPRVSSRPWRTPRAVRASRIT